MTYETLVETAERLHMGKTKLRRLVKDGKIPARRAPGGIKAPFLFIPAEVDAVVLPVSPDNGNISAPPETPG